MMERRSRGDMFGSEYEVGEMVAIPAHGYEYLCEIEKKYFEVQKLVGVEEGEKSMRKRKATLVGLKVDKKKNSQKMFRKCKNVTLCVASAMWIIYLHMV